MNAEIESANLAQNKEELVLNNLFVKYLLNQNKFLLITLSDYREHTDTEN